MIVVSAPLVFSAVPMGTTLYIPFSTYDSNGASVTMTGLAVTDIEIYKNGSTTQRASDNGYTLLDTDGIDFDGITGIHGFSVDLSNNSDAGFYARGAWYTVVVSSVTVSAQTVNFIAAVFRIVDETKGWGTVGAGSTTTSIVTSACDPSGAALDQFKGMIMRFDRTTATTALRGQATDITASTNAAAPTFTVTALTTAPASGDVFTIE